VLACIGCKSLDHEWNGSHKLSIDLESRHDRIPTIDKACDCRPRGCCSRTVPVLTTGIPQLQGLWQRLRWALDVVPATGGRLQEMMSPLFAAFTRAQRLCGREDRHAPDFLYAALDTSARISCLGTLDAAAYAAFIKESRMELASATNTNRKSGLYAAFFTESRIRLIDSDKLNRKSGCRSN
jgi:hypothetical protein